MYFLYPSISLELSTAEGKFAKGPEVITDMQRLALVPLLSARTTGFFILTITIGKSIMPRRECSPVATVLKNGLV